MFMNLLICYDLVSGLLNHLIYDPSVLWCIVSFVYSVSSMYFSFFWYTYHVLVFAKYYY